MVVERYDEGFEWGDDNRTPAERIEQTLSQVYAQLMRLREMGIPATEIDAYASLLLTVASHAMRASRSRGFLGIGGHAISRQEAGFLDRLEDMLEASLPGCDGCLG